MKIHLSEAQVKKLISDYKTLNEQSVGFNPETKTETLNFKSVWNAGFWKMTSKQVQNLNNQMKVIQEFLDANPQTKLTIQVEAGESKVTNADNEPSGGGKAVPEGYLSTKRGASMVSYLNNFFKKLENAGMSFTYPEIPKPKTIIGSTPYNRKTATNPNGDDPKDPKYTPEQFVRLQVTATSQSECLIGLEVMVAYLKGGGEVHTCDEAIFELRMNGVSLGVANLNNGDLDISGFTEAPQMNPKYLVRLKTEIGNVNDHLRYRAKRDVQLKFRKWRTENSKIDGKRNPNYDVGTYVLPGGKTIKQIGGYDRYSDYLVKYYMKNEFPNMIKIPKTGTFDQEFLDNMVKMKSTSSRPIDATKIDSYKKLIGLNWNPEEVSYGDYQGMHKKLGSLPDRKTDNRRGGTRTQTFKITYLKCRLTYIKDWFDASRRKRNADRCAGFDRLLMTVLSPVPYLTPRDSWLAASHGNSCTEARAGPLARDATGPWAWI